MFAGDSKNTDKSPLTTCNLRMAMRIKTFPSIFVAARRGWPMTAFAESDSGDVSGCDTSQSKHDGGSTEAGEMQQTDRSEFSMKTRCLDNALFPVAAACSGEALVPTTIFASSSYDLGESCPATVDVLAFTIAEIFDKRLGGSDARVVVAGCKLWWEGCRLRAIISRVTRTVQDIENRKAKAFRNAGASRQTGFSLYSVVLCSSLLLSYHSGFPYRVGPFDLHFFSHLHP
jgi:hypothetical protein